MLVGGITLLSAVIAAVLCACTGAFGSLTWLWMLPVGFLGVFLALLVLAVLFLWILSLLVDRSVPQEHDSPFYRRVTGIYIQAIVTLVRLRIRTQGLEKTPQSGRFLLVCNHLSNADPAILLHCFPKSQLAFISKRENANLFIVGRVMHKLMCQNVNRENDREAMKTILKCIQLLRDDEVSVAVFPEGYIYPDLKLHHFRSGVFKIAQRTKVPIVVCTLKNTPQIFENLPRLKPTEVELHLLEVIAPEDYEGMTTVALGQRIYEAMAADLGPELVSEEKA